MLAAIILSSWIDRLHRLNGPRMTPGKNVQVARLALEREQAHYLQLRDDYDQQFNAVVEKDGDDPAKMLEIVEKFKPLKAKVDEQEEIVLEAWEKAN